jgi:hypothetical protein
MDLFHLQKYNLFPNNDMLYLSDEITGLLKYNAKYIFLEEFPEGVTRSVPTNNVFRYIYYNCSYDGTTNSNEGHSICTLLHTTDF